MDAHSGDLRRLGPLTAFAASMAFLESAVVVYLRQIYYPEGFAFPLREIAPRTYLIELGREAATVVMLASVAWLAGSPGWGRFACFAFLFGVWDIGYYVWLKAFVNWPSSLFTPDILFLIPIAWIGPVLAPVLVSLLLISGALGGMRLLDRGVPIHVDRWDWIGASAGALGVFYAFTEAAAAGLLLWGGVKAVTAFMPEAFDWPVFLAAYALLAGIAARVLCRSARGPKALCDEARSQ